jgi:hypothetical protein
MRKSESDSAIETALIRNWVENLPTVIEHRYRKPEIIQMSRSVSKIMNAVWTALELGMLKETKSHRIGRWFFRRDVSQKIVAIQKEINGDDQT